MNYLLISLAIAVGIYVLHCEHTKHDYATFTTKLAAQAETQRLKNIEREKANAKQIKDALSERDVALAKLRNRPRAPSLSDPTIAAPVGSRICIAAETYNATMGEFSKSLSRFVEETGGYALAGDEAAIDTTTLLKAWPK